MAHWHWHHSLMSHCCSCHDHFCWPVCYTPYPIRLIWYCLSWWSWLHCPLNPSTNWPIHVSTRKAHMHCSFFILSTCLTLFHGMPAIPPWAKSCFCPSATFFDLLYARYTTQMALSKHSINMKVLHKAAPLALSLPASFSCLFWSP